MQSTLQLLGPDAGNSMSLAQSFWAVRLPRPADLQKATAIEQQPFHWKVWQILSLLHCKAQWQELKQLDCVVPQLWLGLAIYHHFHDPAVVFAIGLNSAVLLYGHGADGVGEAGSWR